MEDTLSLGKVKRRGGRLRALPCKRESVLTVCRRDRDRSLHPSWKWQDSRRDRGGSRRPIVWCCHSAQRGPVSCPPPARSWIEPSRCRRGEPKDSLPSKERRQCRRLHVRHWRKRRRRRVTRPESERRDGSCAGSFRGTLPAPPGLAGGGGPRLSMVHRERDKRPLLKYNLVHRVRCTANSHTGGSLRRVPCTLYLRDEICP